MLLRKTFSQRFLRTAECANSHKSIAISAAWYLITYEPMMLLVNSRPMKNSEYLIQQK